MEFIAHINPNTNKTQSVKTHLQNTAELCSNILKDVKLFNAGYILGLLHDLGKYSDDFQNYIRNGGVKGTVLHTFAAVYLLMENYHDKEMDFYRRIANEMLAITISSHHGLVDCRDFETGEYELVHRRTTDVENSKQSIDRFYSEVISKEELDAYYTLAIDEIVSFIDGTFQKKDRQKSHFDWNLPLRYVSSALSNADKIDTIQFNYQYYGKQLVPDWNRYLFNLDNIYKDFQENPVGDLKLNQIKQEISDTCAQRGVELAPGVYRLNLPTGAGKTYSSLRFALNHLLEHDMLGIFYVAPFCSILEQNSESIKRVIDDNGLFEHFSNDINDFDRENAALFDWYAKDTWDAGVITTTLAQMLLTFFGGRSSSVRRFSALYKKVIIFDEIHQIPSDQISLFNMMIKTRPFNTNIPWQHTITAS